MKLFVVWPNARSDSGYMHAATVADLTAARQHCEELIANGVNPEEIQVLHVAKRDWPAVCLIPIVDDLFTGAVEDDNARNES